METIRRHTSKQRDTLSVVGFALLAVIAYSLWGAYLLHQQEVARATGATVIADNR